MFVLVFLVLTCICGKRGDVIGKKCIEELNDISKQQAINNFYNSKYLLNDIICRKPLLDVQKKKNKKNITINHNENNDNQR
jgi:hypothetical protein